MDPTAFDASDGKLPGTESKDAARMTGSVLGRRPMEALMFPRGK